MLEVQLKVTTVRSNQNARAIQARKGEVLRDALLRHKYRLYQGIYEQFNCRGLGICGSCLVKVRESEEWQERRACQIQCFRPMEIELECNAPLE